MKGLLLAFVFAIFVVGSLGFVDVVSAVLKNATLADTVPESCPPEMVNLTTSARKLNFADPVNSARTIVTSADMPTNLAKGFVTASGGTKYVYSQSISPGWTISEFGTSGGDIPTPVLNYQVGKDAYLPLYTYTVTFNGTLSVADFPKLNGKKIKILGTEYIIVNISNNGLELFGEGKNLEIIDRLPVYVVDGSGSRVAIPGTVSMGWYQNEMGLSFSIGFAMQSYQKDHVAIGESFLNPVFGRLSFVFDNANPNLNDISRGMIKVRTDNNQYGFVTFNSARSGSIGSKELTYVYDKNTSSIGVSPVLAHQTVSSNEKGYIIVREGQNARLNDWIVINQADSGNILEVTDISIDTATSGKVTLQDVITGESQTITVTNGTGTNGVYVKSNVSFFGGTGYNICTDGNMIDITWGPGSSACNPGSATTIFPRIKLKNGGWMTFLNSMTIPGGSTTSVIFPDGQTTLAVNGDGGRPDVDSKFVNGINWTLDSSFGGSKQAIIGTSPATQETMPVGINGRITTDKGVVIEVADMTIDTATSGKVTFVDVRTWSQTNIALTNSSGYYQKADANMFGGIYTVRMNQAGTQVSLIWKTGAGCDFSYNKGPTILLFEPKKWNDVSYGDYVCIPLTTTGITEIAIGDPAIGGINSGYTVLQSDTYQKQAVDMYGSLFQKEDRTNENGVATIKYPASQMYFNALLTAPCVNPSAIRLAPESDGWLTRLLRALHLK